MDFKDKVKNFSELIELKEYEKNVLFSEGETIGFSIKKEYGYDINKLVKTNSGDIDSFCLIRIGYRELKEDELVDLYIDCSLQSKLRQDNIEKFSFDNSLLCKESIKEFNKSIIPISLNSLYNRKFVFNIKTKKFYYKGKEKEISFRDLINDIYNTHLKTGKSFIHYKYSSIVKVSNIILKFGELTFYKLGLKILTGLTFKDENTSLLEMYFGKKQKRSNLMEIESTKTNIKSDLNDSEIDLSFLGGKIKVNKRGLFFSILVLAILSIFYKDNCFILILENYKDNEVILGSIFLTWIISFHIIFEYMLSYFFILLLNGTIYLYKWINDTVSINGYDFDLSNNPYKQN